MRQDQYERLQSLTEKLIDVFTDEADPATWPGVGLKAGEMDQQTRGDRYWCKKNAAATLTVVMRTTTLIGVIQRNADGLPPSNDDGETVEGESSLDKEIAAAEKEASKLIEKMQKKGSAKT